MKKVGYSHIYADIYFILHDIAKEKKIPPKYKVGKPAR